MTAEDIAQKTAQILLKIEAVSFRFDPPFTYTSGLKSPIYLDNRIIMSHPKERRKIVDFYIYFIKEKIGLQNVDYISGTATAAIPQASWVAGELNLPMVFVRPTTKSYGKGNKMEGYLKPGSKVVIIEDHISTATSVENNATTIVENKGLVKYCIATTTYETKQSQTAIQKLGVKLFPLTTGKKIVDEAVRAGVLKKDEQEKIMDWFKNPPTWAKRHGFE